MYTQKIAIIFDHSQGHNGSWSQQIRPGKQILPKQNNPVAHLHYLYFITLNSTEIKFCYKGRLEDTIVFGGNLWVAFLYLQGIPKQNTQAEFFGVRQVYVTKSCQQIWWRVKQPFILSVLHHIWGKQ